MFSARWLYSIYTNKYRYKGKYTSFYASRIHLPGCCMAAPPSCCSISISTSFFTFLLTVNILLLCCLFCLYRLCSARCFLCNISTLQQRAKTLTLTFTFSFCCVLFPAFLLHDANWLLGCRSSAVLCSAVQCAATFTAHFGLCLSAAALGKRYSLSLCLSVCPSLCLFKHKQKLCGKWRCTNPKRPRTRTRIRFRQYEKNHIGDCYQLNGVKVREKHNGKRRMLLQSGRAAWATFTLLYNIMERKRAHRRCIITGHWREGEEGVGGLCSVHSMRKCNATRADKTLKTMRWVRENAK